MFGGYCTGFGVAGWVMMIGLWAGLLGVVVWAVTRIFPSANRRQEPEDLPDQDALGDLDADAYRQLHDETVRGSR